MNKAKQQPARNWFEQGGQSYAAFRPKYPPELTAVLASLTDTNQLVIDVGCGSGQLTEHLATRFDKVVGIDPSHDQLMHASAHPNIQYVCASAESLPIAEGQASLITVAQAAHWFDLPRFYAQATSIGRPDGVIALISYGVLRLHDEQLQARFHSFCHQEIGPYWPPERKLVESGYADLPFPFKEIKTPPMTIELAWDRESFLGYLGTWSAVKRAAEAGESGLLTQFSNDLQKLWSDKSKLESITWPINMRLGRL